MYIKGTKYFLRCSIYRPIHLNFVISNQKLRKKNLIIVITIYSIKKMMTKYKKYREKYVHDDINRNIKAK